MTHARDAYDSVTPKFGVPVNVGFTVDELTFPFDVTIGEISVNCREIVVDQHEVSCPNATVSAIRSPLGPVALQGSAAMDVQTGATRIRAHATAGEQASISINIEKQASRSEFLISLKQLSIPDVMSIVQSMGFDLAGHEFDSGLLNLDAACISTESRSSCRLDGEVDSANINGINVAEDLAAMFRAEFEGNDVSVEIEITDGAFYVEPGFEIGNISPGFYLEPARAPIVVKTGLRRVDDQIRLNRVEFDDHQSLELKFSGDLGFSSTVHWRTLEFSMASADVARFYETYMQPLALDTAFGSLEAAGSVSASIIGSDNEIDGFEFKFNDVYIDDEQGRYALYGLDGDLSLHDGKSDKRSQLRWRGASLYRIQIGQGVIDWVSADRSLKIADWRDVAIFDGGIRIDTLEVVNFSLDGSALALSGTLTPITLSALTAAFDWLPLSGKISGHIPGLRYADNRITLDGALRVNVFDGAIEIRDLTVDQLFSTVPVLKADVAITDLDLEELTRTFSFGYMTGRLEGGVTDLELQAWRPTYFDALIRTVDDDEIRHRISQQAVDNLGRLGAGTGTGLSQGFLGLIPSYSYGHLGIGCRLVNGYCEMRGVKDADGDSFYILTRGGILPPWIDIKGSGRRIKWQTLVDGIKQISEGAWELDIGG